MSAKQTATEDEESARQICGSESLDEAGKVPEPEKWTFAQACALNTLNMFGTGPFITCAILFQTVDPAGPQTCPPFPGSELRTRGPRNLETAMLSRLGS